MASSTGTEHQCVAGYGKVTSLGDTKLVTTGLTKVQWRRLTDLLTALQVVNQFSSTLIRFHPTIERNITPHITTTQMRTYRTSVLGVQYRMCSRKSGTHGPCARQEGSEIPQTIGARRAGYPTFESRV